MAKRKKSQTFEEVYAELLAEDELQQEGYAIVQRIRAEQARRDRRWAWLRRLVRAA